MNFVNKYLRNFKPYPLASHKIWTADKKEWSTILKLDWNEATIAPSPNVEKRIKRLVNGVQFYNLYPATYNEELMKYLENYVKLPHENIQYFSSSDSLHEYIAKLYITVGDPILILGPSYDNFRLTAEVCGGTVYYFNIEEDMVFDKEKFEKTIISIKPSLVYICNPNNPTGTIHEVQYIEHLLVTFPEVLFLIDEAYSEFVGISSKELVLKYENIVISRTMSKAFAIANFRFGYLLASKKNIHYISSIRNPKNITTFAQEAAIGALSDVDYMLKYVKEVGKAKKYFENVLDSLGEWLTYVHGGGNFVLIKCKTSEIKKYIFNTLADQNIYVRDLGQTDWLKKYCLRITIGTTEQMKYVSKVLRKCVKDI